MIPPEEEIKRILIPIHSTIHKIARGAWDDWQQSSEFGHARSPRTRACIIWEHAISRTIEAFLEDPYVRIHEHYGTFSFIVAERVLFRWKKSNEDGYTANYPTQTAMDFHDPEQLEFCGFENYYRIEVGYVLDKLQDKIQRILVIARNNADIAWSYEITPEEIRSVKVARIAQDEAVQPLLKPLTKEEVAEENSKK